MSKMRDAAKIAKVIDGQVFLNLNTETPKIGNTSTGLFGEGWHTAGWLPDGFEVAINKESESEPVKVSNGSTVDYRVKPGDVTATFTLMENNAISRKIAWPNSDNGVLVHDGKNLKAWVAFVAVYANGEIKVQATREMADLSMEALGFAVENEGKEITAKMVAGPFNDIFDEETFIVKGDDIVKLDSKIFVSDTEITGTTITADGKNLTGEDSDVAADAGVTTGEDTTPETT